MRKMLALLAGLLTGALTFAAPAVADPSVPRDEIYAQLGVDRVPADYVILVDTSSSMFAENRYGGVRDTLLPFLRGLSGTDRVALYTFDALPTLQYQGAAGNPEAVVAALPPSPTPNGQTDIGAAVDAALKQLERSDSADVATIVLVTDGAQHAPATSAYRDTSSVAWASLTGRANALTGKTVNAYALPLGTADGARLLGQVFPQATVLDAGAVRDLGPYLDQAKEATRRSKAAQVLSGDAGHGVTVRWEMPSRLDFRHNTQRVRAELRSTTAHVPLTVTGLAVHSTNPLLAARPAESTVTLAPGQSATVDVELVWEPDAGPNPVHRSLTKSTELTLTGTTGSPWTAALESVAPLQFPAAPAGPPAALTMTAEVGNVWALPAIVAAALVLAALIWLAIYRRRRPFMPGALSIRPIGEERELARFRLNRRRPLDLRAPGLPGAGTVRGRRSTGGSVEVSYTPDGSESRRTITLLRPREPLILSGLTFLHHAGDGQGREG